MQAYGHRVSGSDDALFDPALSRLKANGLAPDELGWHPEKLTSEIDLVVLGMHARADNPELARAKELNLHIVSFPEFMYSQALDKQRIVIAGSHGKTTSTAMLLFLLKELGKETDYLVGSLIDGFERMVHVSPTSTLAVYEGDEYLTSPADMRPKFLWYKPHLAMITGIAWDHINVFPTLAEYHKQFELFIETIQPGGLLAYFEGDEVLAKLAASAKGLRTVAYGTPVNRIENGQTIVIWEGKEYPMLIYGDHNLQNLEGIRQLALELGIESHQFFGIMTRFGGTARRLETLFQYENGGLLIRDFAHAPSKVKASVSAVKHQFPKQPLIAVLELHTFSSLNPEFIVQYVNCLDPADEAIVYYNLETFRLKQMEPLHPDVVKEAFGGKVKVFTSPDELSQALYGRSNQTKATFLLMSSGSFDGLVLASI